MIQNDWLFLTSLKISAIAMLVMAVAFGVASSVIALLYDRR